MTITAKFPGTCTRCYSRIQVGQRIVWEPSVKATFHLNASDCQAAKAARVAREAAASAATPTIDMKPIADFISAARARGLKFPNCRFLAPGGGELRLYVSGNRAQVPGAITVLLNDKWIGRINPDGSVHGFILIQRSDVRASLTKIAADPAAAAKEYGTLNCRCSFCNRKLEDEGSVEVGYGPACAKAYGLPHKPKGAKVLTQVA